MARSAKGKRASRPEQKASGTKKIDVPVQKAQAVQVEQPKGKGPATVKADTPEITTPVQPSGPVERAINFFKANVTWCTLIIIVLMAFMLYLRVVPSHDTVFTDWPWINGATYVNVAEDDGVYHMRLLYNTLEHFPFRIMYDPFTHFPYGNTIHFGPLFELIPAAIILALGLGHPSPPLIDTVAAYFPAFLGMLVIIPAYYIGKKLFGRPAGLAAALILAFMPGAFFSRSILGATDHHIAEVLFMACTIACLIYALDSSKVSGLSFEQLRRRDWKELRTPLLYAALTGMFFGAYLLTWVGALLLAFALFVYFTLQSVIDHYRGRQLEPLLILSAFIFLIPALMVLPYSLSNLTFQEVYYSITQPLVFMGAFAAVGIEYGISKVLRDNRAGKWAFPVVLAGIGAAGILILYLLAPSFFGLVQYSIAQLWPTGGTNTIGEAFPTFMSRFYPGEFTFEEVWISFYLAFPAAVLGLALIFFRAFKTGRRSEIMFLVWNLVMAWALVAQNRFTYYFAVNAALLTAYVVSTMFGVIGLDGLKASFARKVDSFDSFQRFVGKNMGSCLAVAIVVLALGVITIYPALPMSDMNRQNEEGALFQVAKYGGSPMPRMWFDALTWMRNNTPDPQGSPVSASFDYAAGQYYRTSGDRYDYPASAYGVMSWWDYGHIIEYVAQRIPNANPFQAGIIEEDGTVGASPFFCSLDEAASIRNLDRLGSRYVIIDNQMATRKFGPIQEWIGDNQGWEERSNITCLYGDGTSLYSGGRTVPIIRDTDKWNRSIMNRLYYHDADGMSHYRLVYESTGPYYVNIKGVVDGQYIGISPSPAAFNDLTNATDVYEMYSRYAVAQDSGATTYGFDARPPVKWVKIFEKVKGATLTGSAPDGANVTALLMLKNDDGREFNYTATTTARNGTYAFVVPYPTEPMKGTGYTYAVTPGTAYAITIGDTTKSVGVPESAVMDGATIRVT